ncbi:MAG TPA: NAD(P)/FAD-dependent oxidoreductase [Rhodothermales bacterium]|nr:NAD(P)/FAD-dependent oxidoreductase [Rhodothermales bacterium]
MPEAPAPGFDYDVAVVGGGPAGLSAALTLARAGRSTVLYDDNRPRNGPAWYAHGLLTRDGESPEEIRRLGRLDVLRYGGAIREAEVSDAVREDEGFRLTVADDEVRVRVVVLAPGVVDELPEIEGLVACWGLSVAHCPYCHGAEFRDRPTALLGRGTSTYKQARFLLGWTDDLTIVTNGPEDLDRPQEADLDALGIRINRTPLARLRHREGCLEALEFDDGTEIPCAILYVQPPQHVAGPLAQRLGVTFTGKGRIAADADGRTGVPGVFACGDAVNVSQSLAAAIAGGVAAGMTANHDLICGVPAGTV